MRDGESAVVTPLSPKACWLFFCARSWDRLWVARTSPAPCAMHRPEAFAPAPARSPYRQRSSVRASTRRWARRPVSDSSSVAGLWPVQCAEVSASACVDVRGPSDVCDLLAFILRPHSCRRCRDAVILSMTDASCCVQLYPFACAFIIALGGPRFDQPLMHGRRAGCMHRLKSHIDRAR